MKGVLSEMTVFCGASEVNPETGFVQKWFTREHLQDIPEAQRASETGQGGRPASQVSLLLGRRKRDQGLYYPVSSRPWRGMEVYPLGVGTGHQFPGTFSSPWAEAEGLDGLSSP